MKRSRMEIIFEILRSVESGVDTKTRLMYASNLDWRNFSRYIDYMLKEQLIYCNSERFYLTERGRKLLGKLKDVLELLNLRQH
ncbi:MAG: winged helix-turn-helix domain-containing protein [Archaeoglobales archaeon]|nr:winged helix-turn-helix domain-containing protein [Archaeoglobales archaeon]